MGHADEARGKLGALNEASIVWCERLHSSCLHVSKGRAVPYIQDALTGFLILFSQVPPISIGSLLPIYIQMCTRDDSLSIFYKVLLILNASARVLLHRRRRGSARGCLTCASTDCPAWARGSVRGSFQTQRPCGGSLRGR
jgi:hypothetical protein